MRKEFVRTIMVEVSPTYHEILERHGFCVIVHLNGHPTLSEFKHSQEIAEERARVIRNRPIPKNAEIGCVAGTWLPLTSCNPLLRLSK